MSLIALSLAWLLGIVLGTEAAVSPLLLSLSVALSLALLGLGVRHRRLLSWGLACLLLTAGLGRAGLVLPAGEASLTAYNGTGVRQVYGVVRGVELWSRGVRLELEAGYIWDGEQRQPVRGKALVYLSPLASYEYGDRLMVTGRLESPRGGGSRVTSLSYYPKVRLVERGDGVARRLYQVRQGLAGSLGRSLPEPQAALAQTLLLGLRGNLSPSLRDDFFRSGTAHLLAISGLHIAVFAGMVMSGAAYALGRHRPYYLLLALALVVLYVLLSGLRPPTVRAAIMVAIFFWGQWIGRPRASLTALAFAAAVMVGINPGLIGDASFQLSFVAMAGLILLSPAFQALGRRLSLPGVVGESLAYSSGAVIATLPLVAYYFGRVSWGSLPATLLAAPALPGAVATSGLTALLGVALPGLAQAVGWLAWLFLFYITSVVNAFASLPGISLPLSLGPLWVWGLYSGLAAALLLRLPGGRQRLRGAMNRLASAPAWFYPRLPLRGLAFSLLLASALVWAAVLSLPDDRLQVSILEVGQGEAILIQQGSRQILIDGGPSPQAIASALSRELPFWDRTIDGVVLTHPHADHLTGLYEVLRRYQVGWAMAPLTPAPSPAYQRWQELVASKGVPLLQAEAGVRIHIGEAVLEVLHPGAALLSGTGEDVDNNSAVMRLKAGGVSFLFTADLHQEGEQALLGQGARLRSTVLKVAHHGSRTSTSPAFLAVVSPQVAVISAGPGSGLPHPEVMASLEARLGQDRIYLTSQRGTIELITDSDRLWVKTER